MITKRHKPINLPFDLSVKTQDEVDVMFSSCYCSLCRVKEHNPVYDKFFGEGCGWIYRTNIIDYYSASVAAAQMSKKTGFKHTIDYVTFYSN